MPHPITFTRRVVALLIALLLVSLVPAQATHAQTAQRCFAETNQCISGAIRQYWERNGGLAVFGFPITAQSAETVEGRTLQVQWFERDRLEIQANGQVTAGRLGVERLEQQGTPWQYGPGEAADAGCFAFAETGHRTCGAFAAYWQRNGGLERFGFPITGAYETEIQGIRLTVQYFERRRFELHNANTVLLGLLGSEVRSSQPSAPTTAPGNVHPFVSEVIRLTNQARQANGCSVQLTMNAQLNQAAQSHSEDMARRSYFSHVSPEGVTPADRVDATGYDWQMIGENIAAGYPSPAAVVAGWMDSPGHRANILQCSFTEIGVGYVERSDDPRRMFTYWTQVFGRPW